MRHGSHRKFSLEGKDRVSKPEQRLQKTNAHLEVLRSNYALEMKSITEATRK